MNSSLERRYALLKARVGGNPIVLHLPDGTVRQINGTVKHYFALWNAGAALYAAETAGEPIPGTPLDAEIAWIKSAVKIDEPAHQFELMRALLTGPNLEGEPEQ